MIASNAQLESKRLNELLEFELGLLLVLIGFQFFSTNSVPRTKWRKPCSSGDMVSEVSWDLIWQQPSHITRVQTETGWFSILIMQPNTNTQVYPTLLGVQSPSFLFCSLLFQVNLRIRVDWESCWMLKVFACCFFIFLLVSSCEHWPSTRALPVDDCWLTARCSTPCQWQAMDRILELWRRTSTLSSPPSKMDTQGHYFNLIRRTLKREKKSDRLGDVPTCQRRWMERWAWWRGGNSIRKGNIRMLIFGMDKVKWLVVVVVVVHRHQNSFRFEVTVSWKTSWKERRAFVELIWGWTLNACEHTVWCWTTVCLVKSVSISLFRSAHHPTTTLTVKSIEKGYRYWPTCEHDNAKWSVLGCLFGCAPHDVVRRGGRGGFKQKDPSTTSTSGHRGHRGHHLQSHQREQWRQCRTQWQSGKWLTPMHGGSESLTL